MKIFISVDDTDNPQSHGSGYLSASLAKALVEDKLAANCSNITRHQLYVHPSIPYTSGNSSMCFSAYTDDDSLDGLIRYSADYLSRFSAEGSDPGLCVATADDTIDRSRLIQFGQDAKQIKISKDEAYRLAGQHNVHLSEHGGTGLGVIGALAAFGLRLGGNDGRFRGWLRYEEAGTWLTVADLISHPWVDEVIDETSYQLQPDERVKLAEDTVKTVLRNHRQVIVVKKMTNGSGSGWRTCTKPESKNF